MPKISSETRELRRAQILEAAWRCFYRNGVQATTMEEIIAEAGMSASAMYRYFANKEDIIVTAIRTSLGGLSLLLAPTFADTAAMSPAIFVGKVAGAIEAFSARQGYNLASIAIHGWSEAQRNEAVRTLIRDFYLQFREMLAGRVRRWQACGELPPDADAESVANTLLSVVLGFVVQAAVMRDASPRAHVEGLAALSRGASR